MVTALAAGGHNDGMGFRRHAARHDADVPLLPGPFQALALYNSERERGLVHTAEWDARMAALQAEFDDWVAHVTLNR